MPEKGETVRCPKCGARVRASRLEGHVAKAHPKGAGAPAKPAARAVATPWGARLRTMAPVVAVIAVVAVVAFALTNMPRAIAYSDHYYYDMGDVGQTTTPHDFALENVGDGELALLGASTSCGCTTVQLLTRSGESPVFGMPGHGDTATWGGATLYKGDSATVRVFYDALVHEDLYAGERQAYVETSAGEITFTIKVHEVR